MVNMALLTKRVPAPGLYHYDVVVAKTQSIVNISSCILSNAQIASDPRAPFWPLQLCTRLLYTVLAVNISSDNKINFHTFSSVMVYSPLTADGTRFFMSKQLLYSMNMYDNVISTVSRKKGFWNTWCLWICISCNTFSRLSPIATSIHKCGSCLGIAQSEKQ